MSHNVSSWFLEQSFSKKPAGIVRKFTIGNSDYSSRVMKWPSFNRNYNDIRPISLKVSLANADGGMNFIKEDKTIMENECALSFGFTHPTSGDEVIDMFSGKMNGIRYRSEKFELTVTDKFKQLTERVMGSSDVPVDYTGSNYLPSDIAWWAITSFGGYDNVASTSNVDINFDTFSAWAKVFSADAVFIEAEFKGLKVSEALRKIARYTESSIDIDDNKISFHRFSIADSFSAAFNNEDIIDLDYSYDQSKMVNKQYVYADYDTTSKFHKITVHASNSGSVNSYGLREAVEKDNSLWYVNSLSGINSAERKILVSGEPNDSVLAKSGLQGFPMAIGETLTVTDSFFGVTDSYRIMGTKFNMDIGRSEMRIDKTQLFNAFILDTSTLDSLATLI